MKKVEHHNPIDKAERFEPNIESGLNNFQVEQRHNEHLTNKTKLVVGKSYFEIIRSDVFSFFDIILYVVAALMIWGEYYSGLFFLVVLIPNIIIALYQDIRARHLVSKLKSLNPAHVLVLREGIQQEIDSSQVVLDDIVILRAGDSVPCDGRIVKGACELDCSAITGESEPIYSVEGNDVLSGSIVIGGTCYLKVEKVGKYSYIESVRLKANASKRKPSVIIKSLNKLYLVVGIIAVVIFLLTGLVYYLQDELSSVEAFKSNIGSLSGSIVSLIPSGLYLLTSLSLGTGAITLMRKKVMVQDIYALEMLARVDVMCVDKTGTITDGDMTVKNLIAFNGVSKDDLKYVISNILNATQDNNDTAEALRNAFYYPLNTKVVTALPFNSINKYSGATFEKGKTYYMGAPEYLNLEDRAKVLRSVREYTKKGYRVLVIAQGTSAIKDQKATGKLIALGAVVLEDHVRESAIVTFKKLVESGVNIKVISGDNENTVSQVAMEAGIPDADLCVSLAGITDEAEIRKLATEYTVFGRVQPDQKRILIEALHDAGHCVGMTGDGVNDILALKKADCSIAMKSGSDAAQNVSHLVLLDSDFSHLPDVIYEGRRTINNIQRMGSLFLIKTMFAIFYSVVFIIVPLVSGNANLRYPFYTNNMYIWEFLGIGIPGFFIALEGSNEPIQEGFMKNILVKALPGAFVMIAAVGAVFIYGIIIRGDTGGFDIELMRSMASIVMGLLSVWILLLTCMPLSKFRFSVCVTAIALAIIIIVGFGALGLGDLLNIHYEMLNGTHYFIIVLVILTFALLYLFITYIINASIRKTIAEHSIER
ncbi:MAG: HAD-IC family P-type ATPase [Coprobacillus sp.]|nr:HAD-IC family P-type ATPase [Coprobacillus sp.]